MRLIKSNLKSIQNTFPKMSSLDYVTNYSFHYVICNHRLQVIYLALAMRKPLLSKKNIATRLNVGISRGWDRRLLE